MQLQSGNERELLLRMLVYLEMKLKEYFTQHQLVIDQGRLLFFSVDHLLIKQDHIDLPEYAWYLIEHRISSSCNSLPTLSWVTPRMFAGMRGRCSSCCLVHGVIGLYEIIH